MVKYRIRIGSDLMIGYIDVGGGLRAVYGAGVLDYCADNNMHFDYYVGVSAGSANIASFMAGQRGRARRFYLEYTFRREYMSVYNFAKTGSYIDLDYIYSELSNEGGEDPFDYEKFEINPAPLVVVATNAKTGEAEYFYKGKDTGKDEYDIFKISCTIPIVNKAYPLHDSFYYDGGLSDPIPIRKALEDGCNKVVVTLTRPLSYLKHHWVPDNIVSRIMKDYPESAKTLQTSVDKYNEDIEYIKKLEKEGMVLIVAPDSCCGVETLTKRRKNIQQLYLKGYDDAQRIADFIK
ncbi:MAG: patatin family protein [Clostridiales bacterium]|nr:patatin family protein [Clostridiales bacterium]